MPCARERRWPQAGAVDRPHSGGFVVLEPHPLCCHRIVLFCAIRDPCVDPAISLLPMRLTVLAWVATFRKQRLPSVRQGAQWSHDASCPFQERAHECQASIIVPDYLSFHCLTVNNWSPAQGLRVCGFSATSMSSRCNRPQKIRPPSLFSGACIMISSLILNPRMRIHTL